MLRQPWTVLDDRPASVAKSGASPESAPAIVIEDLRRAGVSLIERRHNPLTRLQRLISRKAAGNRAVEVRFLQCILEAPADTYALQLAHVQHQLHAFGARRMEINRDKNAADRDLVIFKTVMAGVEICIQLQAYSWVQFLCPSRFEIILCVRTHIAYSLIRVNCVMPNETSQQRVLNWWRGKVAVVGRVQYRFSLREVVRQSDTRASLCPRIHEIEVVVSQPKIHGQIADGREVVLRVDAGLSAQQTTTERRKHIGITTTVKEEAFVLAQPRQVDARFEKMSAPIMREIALDSQR